MITETMFTFAMLALTTKLVPRHITDIKLGLFAVEAAAGFTIPDVSPLKHIFPQQHKTRNLGLVIKKEVPQLT